MKKETKAEGWIDVHDDNVMRAMGLWRPYDRIPRDKSVWTKTDSERKALKRVKHSSKRDMHFHAIPRKFIRVYGNLIIQLKKNKMFPKTTYSIPCWQSNIPQILSKYIVNKHNRSESIVAKYKWNGKTYYPNQLPF